MKAINRIVFVLIALRITHSNDEFSGEMFQSSEPVK
jgi:hypothetical protein